MKPIIFFDIESTGVDVAKDRIITLAAKKFTSLSGFEEDSICFSLNPGIPIPAEATDVHGISDVDVAHWPPFSKVAPDVFSFFSDCDLAGRILSFDITNDDPVIFAFCVVCNRITERRIVSRNE